MKPVIVRNVRIGEGMPKICVPIVGFTREQILEEGRNLISHPMDVVEWRVDFYQDCYLTKQVVETAGLLREILGEIPLLFTFRTKGEGGEKEISGEQYKNLNLAAASSGFVDLIDVEAFFDENLAREIIDKVHQAGKKVIVSNHDFNKTPDREEIVRRLAFMRELGGDIPKIAVMPQSEEDVLTLLSATLETSKNLMDCPIITMSMGKCGMVSRLSGGLFGSALTFGTVGKSSAPGQVPAGRLREILEMLRL
ncbi:MAG: type I 3-dehydroquinate dehydratase [Roseburia sp.]|nr:type I 3-dehydroquinate dehydratase [Roseburia sp.]